MKFIHLSDLHLGKRLNEFSLLEDQAYILEECLRIVGEERPDAVILAGDIYDKTVPPAEAVGLLDDFLTEAAAMTRVLLIAGADKTDIVMKAMYGPITPEVPASILQLHKDVTVILVEA